MLNKAIKIDCVDGMMSLNQHSVDMIFADLPYGITQNDWDKQIPLDKMWEAINHCCKQNAAIIFTGQQPFTSLLISSNINMFKFEMIWQKNKPRGFLNAKKQPLRIHENILIFYNKQPTYNVQMTHGHSAVHAYTKHTSDGNNYGSTKQNISGGGSTSRYPTSILKIPVVNNDSSCKYHPTQKPIELMDWFIKTYTNPGDLIIDPTCGSGSTLVAAKKIRRNYIGFDSNQEWVDISNKRLMEED